MLLGVKVNQYSSEKAESLALKEFKRIDLHLQTPVYESLMRKIKREDIALSGPYMIEPLVSIVTPAYNAQSFLQLTIDSVLDQTYSNWELLVVVDSKSKDSTAQIAEVASQQDQRIKVIQSPDCKSLSANRNKAIDLAQGDYIAFLDSDDRWLPNKLDIQVNTMLKNNLDISYHSFAVINESGAPCGPTRIAKYDVGFQDLLKNNCIGCLTVMVKKAFINSQRMKEVRHEDLDFWLQLLKDGGTAKPITTPLAEYRIRKNSVSENKLQCAIWRWRLYRNIGLSLHKSAYYMILYVIFAFYKRVP